MNLNKYNRAENMVILLVMVPFSIIINGLSFGAVYFTNWSMFILATLGTSLAGALHFMFCAWLAQSYKQQYPEQRRQLKRLTITIISFLLISGLFLYLLFHGYDAIGFFGYRFSQRGFVGSYCAMGILNIFLIFLIEGISRYKDWKANLQEMEKLNAAYKESQLNGLKSQVNPHFLFNSLNSLSGLIMEDESKAEKFLDEMSKVYRYMLHNDEEKLVPLERELRFTDSYMHLLKARYGSGLQLTTVIREVDKQKLIAPLSLQVIIENAFSQNIISKSSPLTIEISSGEDNSIRIRNNVQPKMISGAVDFDSGLDNLIMKYELLNKPVTVNDSQHEYRVISIPLFNQKEEAMV